MSYTLTISQAEPVIIAYCQHCTGCTLYFIERFMTEYDRCELFQLKSAGARIELGTLLRVKDVEACECPEQKPATP